MTTMTPDSTLPLAEDRASAGTVRLRCLSVTELNTEVREFAFELVEGTLAPYEAGQHLVLLADTDGGRLRRSYTISSPPTRPQRVAITVKREVTGAVSRWLHDHISVGDTVTALDRPQGAFTFAALPAERYLMLAGGVGVTPFLAMLRASHDLGSAPDVTLLHHVRSPALLIARAELEFLSHVEPWFDYRPVCEAGSQDWLGPLGRITAAGLAAAVPDLRKRTVLVCGPPAFVDAAYDVVAKLGVPAERRHTETFLSADAPGPAWPDSPEAPALVQASEHAFRVRFSRSGREFDCRPDQTVLEAALDAGLPAAFSCGEGMCGTCKTSLLEGRVDMVHQGGIRPREIDNGYVLLCCSKPLEDVVVDG